MRVVFQIIPVYDSTCKYDIRVSKQQLIPYPRGPLACSSPSGLALLAVVECYSSPAWQIWSGQTLWKSESREEKPPRRGKWVMMCDVWCFKSAPYRRVRLLEKYLRTTALISAPGWQIQSGDSQEWRESCLEVTLEVESWGMETGWDMVRSVSKMLRCHVIFRFYLIFLYTVHVFVNSGWKALERISTQSVSKHHIASQSSFFNGPDCHSAGRDFRVRARATKDCRSGPSVFRRGCFPLFSRKRTRTIDRRIRIDQDWQQTAGLAASHSGSFWWYLVENGKIR